MFVAFITSALLCTTLNLSVPPFHLPNSTTFMMSSVMYLLQPSLNDSFASVFISAGSRIPIQTAFNSSSTLPLSVDRGRLCPLHFILACGHGWGFRVAAAGDILTAGRLTVSAPLAASPCLVISFSVLCVLPIKHLHTLESHLTLPSWPEMFSAATCGSSWPRPASRLLCVHFFLVFSDPFS